jgi:hypothetical protein
MFKAMAQLWSALAVLFGAVERLASATDHLAAYAEESAEGWTETARVERRKALAILEAEDTPAPVPTDAVPA